MFEIRSLFLVVPIAAVCILEAPMAGHAQDSQSSQPAEQGRETDNNWVGLAPFIHVPTFALSENAKQSVRDMEDRQLQERRTLEDKYQTEIRALLKKQADEREEMALRLAQP